MIPPGVLGLANQKQQRAYLRRLFGSHDYSLRVQILTQNEHLQGSAHFLGGAKQMHAGAPIRTSASLTISDPEGALDFSGASQWDGRAVWADRLIRVRHSIYVPDLSRSVEHTAFIGYVTAMKRNGAEVAVECQDKMVRAMRGVPPFTVWKGRNAVDAIRAIFRERCGEFRFRLPKSKRRLSKSYTVGWTEKATPYKVAARIARDELDMQLLYSTDGYLLLRPRPRHVSLRVPLVTGLPQNDVDFKDLDNWVRVYGKKTTKRKKQGSKIITTTKQPTATARMPAGRSLSAESLRRKGVPWYWPHVEEDDGLRKMTKVKKRARDILARSDQLEDAPTYTTIPFFHADPDDLVELETPEGDMRVRLGEVTIPFDTSGDMSIGTRRPASRAPGVRVRGNTIRTRTVRVPRRNNDNDNDGRRGGRGGCGGRGRGGRRGR